MLARSAPIDFEHADPLWTPEHPAFGHQLNASSSMLPYLEPYLIKVMKQARARIPQEQAALLRDLDVFIQQVGPANGVPVLFIHGLGAWSETWRPTMETLAEAGYRCIAVDLPPFGYSRRPANRDYSTVAQARRILGVLESAHVRRPLMPISDEERAHLAAVLTEVGLLREPVTA